MPEFHCPVAACKKGPFSSRGGLNVHNRTCVGRDLGTKLLKKRKLAREKEESRKRLRVSTREITVGVPPTPPEVNIHVSLLFTEKLTC